MSTQPKSVLAVVGESAEFEVSALGDQPLTYQWFQNDEELDGEEGEVLVLSNLALSDSNTYVFCEISNDQGTVFSDSALLQVTTNQRPTPTLEILSGNTYKAGDTLRFTGSGVDPELGILDSSQLRFKIDFHHDEHFHPVLGWTSLDSGRVIIPTAGELDTNVWFRIQLEATDEVGLSATTDAIVSPELESIKIEVSPPYLGNVNADGTPVGDGEIIRTVRGMTRTFLAEEFILLNDSIFEFTSWNDSIDDPILLFDAVDDGLMTVKADYSFVQEYQLGSGDGLLAYYFEGAEKDNTPDATQIDPNIDFNWSWSSPAEGIYWQDYVVEWSGYLLAPFTEVFRLDLTVLGSAKLYINDSLRLDISAVGDFPETDSVKIDLLGDTFYKIEVHYDKEALVFGQCHLSWKHPYAPEEVIPEVQLYSTEPLSSGENLSLESLKIFPNPVTESVRVNANNSQFHNQEVTWKIFGLDGKQIGEGTGRFISTELTVPVESLASGFYILSITNIFNQKTKNLEFVKD